MVRYACGRVEGALARRSGGNQAGSNLDKRQLEAVHSEPVCRLSLSVNPVQMTFSSAKTVAHTPPSPRTPHALDSH